MVSAPLRRRRAARNLLSIAAVPAARRHINRLPAALRRLVAWLRPAWRRSGSFRSSRKQTRGECLIYWWPLVDVIPFQAEPAATATTGAAAAAALFASAIVVAIVAASLGGLAFRAKPDPRESLASQPANNNNRKRRNKASVVRRIVGGRHLDSEAAASSPSSPSCIRQAS